MEVKKRYKYLDIIIVAFLLLTSGYLGIRSISHITIPLFIMSIFIFSLHKCKLDSSTVIASILFAILLLIQKLKWGGSIGNVLNIELQIISFGLLAICVRKTFITLFPRAVYIISLISLFFYLIDQIGGHSVLLAIAQNFPLHLENQNDTMDGYSFLLYVVDAGGGIRNSGPFFEPGRYAVVLCIAISLNLLLGKKYFCKENVVLLLTLLTTLSVSGFSTLIIVSIVYLISSDNKHKTVYLLLLIISAIFVIPFLENADFFGGKIADNLDKIDDSNSRFGALVYLWWQIIESPIVGYGPVIYLIEQFDTANVSSPNGWGELMRFWGIPMFILFITSYCRFADANQYYGLKNRLLAVMGIVIVAFSQSVMTTPLYYVMMFIGFSSFSFNNKII